MLNVTMNNSMHPQAENQSHRHTQYSIVVMMMYYVIMVMASRIHSGTYEVFADELAQLILYSNTRTVAPSCWLTTRRPNLKKENNNDNDRPQISDCSHQEAPLDSSADSLGSPPR